MKLILPSVGQIWKSETGAFIFTIKRIHQYIEVEYSSTYKTIFAKNNFLQMHLREGYTFYEVNSTRN